MTDDAIDVRRLYAEDLALAPPLLAPEGWTFEVRELTRLHELGGAVGAFDEKGEMVGFLSFLDAPPLRWIGNVAVHPNQRGGGLGTRLVEEAMRDARGSALYSVLKAVTMYERLGFKRDGEAWNLRADRVVPFPFEGVETMQETDMPDVLALDREATGTDRTALLNALRKDYPDHALVLRGDDGELRAFGVAKTYGDVTEIGPVVAPRLEDGLAVLDALLVGARGPYEIVVLERRSDLRDALAQRGFETAFRTVLMFHDQEPDWRPKMVVAAAGLEKG